jgi:hypothetical protein
MKTVRLLSQAMADIASAARERLLAMSVAAAMAVMQAMFEAEITEACGPQSKHNPERLAARHGAEKGSVSLGGQRVSACPPRAASPKRSWSTARRSAFGQADHARCHRPPTR